MGDKKYVKLNPAKMGYKFRGMLPLEQRSILFDAFESLKRNMGTRRWNYRLKAKRIFWINVWQEDEDDIDAKRGTVQISRIARALDKWCRKAARYDPSGCPQPRGSGQSRVLHVRPLHQRLREKLPLRLRKSTTLRAQY